MISATPGPAIKPSLNNLWVCIPALDEQEWLPETLHSLAQQSAEGFHVVVCVNQPDAWWRDPVKVQACERNISTIAWLGEPRSYPFSLSVIDRASPGRGWKPGKGGAGMARKVAMDYAFEAGGDNAMFVSADADTRFDPGYLQSVASRFEEFPDALALAAPYYHPLPGPENLDMSMLHYEFFMRFYLLNLMRVRSPYAFTAIGSAMAVTHAGYKTAGGVPPRSSGEDFYLLQKIAKAGRVLLWIPATVYPAARLSLRVDFGTGQALAYRLSGRQERYAVINPARFDKLGALYDCFPQLWMKDVQTPADSFLSAKFGDQPVWQPLRDNAAGLTTFVKACHQKFDGLRIWQWLRHEAADDDPVAALQDNIRVFLPDFELSGSGPESHSSERQSLIRLRDALFNLELKMRKDYDEQT